jgi:hypothetical protein
MIGPRMQRGRRLLHRMLLFILVGLLMHAPQILAQIASAGTPPVLHIVILEDEGALNNIKERNAREPIVQAQDDNHKPVAGVAILFFVNSGTGDSGATFSGLPSYSTVTDAEGKATGKGFHPNAHSGSYTISVSATVGTVLVAEAVIPRTNEIPVSTGHNPTSSGHSSIKWTLIGGAVAAGIAIGVVLSHRNNPAIITAGNGTVTNP